MDHTLFLWLLTPISGASDHHIAVWTSWHARMMVLAWGVLLPMGVLVARFFKVTPRQDWPTQLDNKTWWHWHRALQLIGLVVMAVGVCLAWGHGSGMSKPARWHAWLGLTLSALGAFQALGGWLRGSKGGPTDPNGVRGDHYDMTLYRVAFEVLHKTVGYSALLMAVAVIFLGLWLADAPRWMWLVVGTWWCALGAACCVLQRQGYCMDTYQAIWGTDEALPGNRRKPVGWGVRRFEKDAFRTRFRRRA